MSTPASLEAGEKDTKRENRWVVFLRRFFSAVFIQVFFMTFMAEWGDRSQIATIALAADKDPIGVTIGGFIGHSLCTGVAVRMGKWLAARISEKAVSVIGGILFLIFAAVAVLEGTRVDFT